MRFACEQCQTKYTIPDERVRGKILKIRCKNCNCQITISEGGVRTARPVESAGGDTIIPTKNVLSALGEGGDATMIGGMADFFAAPGPGAADKSAAADEWYVSVDGNTAGPMPLLELAQRVVAEEATPGRDLFVWREGFGAWLPPPEVEEVKLAVAKERRMPKPAAIKPAAIKPALAARLQPLPARTAAPVVNLGAALSEDSEDATQIGSLSAPTGPPPGRAEHSDLALEAVDFDAVTDLPAPPKPQPKPVAPAKPKGPPAFKPPPFPGLGPASKPAPPRSAPGVQASPPAVAATAPVMLSSSQLISQSVELGASPSVNSELLTEETTGAITGAAVSSAMQTPAASPSSSRPDYPPSSRPDYPPSSRPDYPPSSQPDAYPMSPPSQPPMGMMGGQQSADLAAQSSGGMAGGASGMGAPPVDPGAELSASIPAKQSPLLLAALAIVVVLGVSATVWVVTRPSKPTSVKHEIVDAGPPVDAMPTDPVTPDIAKTKPPKAKKEELLGINAEQKTALLEKNEKALSSCYGKALKKDPKLAGSSLSVEVTISAKGKIDTVEIAAQGKGIDGKLDKCLQKSIKRWKFPKRADKNAYQVKFALPVEG